MRLNLYVKRKVMHSKCIFYDFILLLINGIYRWFYLYLVIPGIPLAAFELNFPFAVLKLCCYRYNFDQILILIFNIKIENCFNFPKFWIFSRIYNIKKSGMYVYVCKYICKYLPHLNAFTDIVVSLI